MFALFLCTILLSELQGFSSSIEEDRGSKLKLLRHRRPIRRSIADRARVWRALVDDEAEPAPEPEAEPEPEPEPKEPEEPDFEFPEPDANGNYDKEQVLRYVTFDPEIMKNERYEWYYKRIWTEVRDSFGSDKKVYLKGKKAVKIPPGVHEGDITKMKAATARKVEQSNKGFKDHLREIEIDNQHFKDTKQFLDDKKTRFVDWIKRKDRGDLPSYKTGQDLAENSKSFRQRFRDKGASIADKIKETFSRSDQDSSSSSSSASAASKGASAGGSAGGGGVTSAPGVVTRGVTDKLAKETRGQKISRRFRDWSKRFDKMNDRMVANPAKVVASVKKLEKLLTDPKMITGVWYKDTHNVLTTIIAFHGAINDVSSTLAADLTDLADKEQWKDAGKYLSKKIEKLVGERVGKLVGKLGKKIGKLFGSMDSSKGIGKLVKNLGSVIKGFGRAVKAAGKVMKAVSKIAAAAGPAMAGLGIIAGGFEIAVLVMAANDPSATPEEQTMQNFNKIFDEFDVVFDRLDQMEKSVMEAIKRVEQAISETEEELKDHLMYALGLSTIRESVIELSGLAAMIRLKDVSKNMKTFKEDLEKLCRQKKPHYLLVQLAEKIKRPAGVEGYSVFELYIRLRGVSYSNAQAFVEFIVSNLVRGLTTAEQCYGFMRTKPSDAISRMKMLGEKGHTISVSDCIRFIYQIIYDGFEKYTYKLGKPIMSEGVTTRYKRSNYRPYFETESAKEIFQDSIDKDNDVAVKITTNFYPQKTNEDQAYKPERKCTNVVAEKPDKEQQMECGDSKTGKDACYVSDYYQIKKAPLEIRLNAELKNGDGSPHSMGQTFKTDMWWAEMSLLPNKTQPFERGYVRGGDLLYNGRVQFLINGTVDSQTTLYKNIRFKGFLEFDYKLAYNIWLSADCGAGDTRYKTKDNGEEMGKYGSIVNCGMNDFDGQSFKVWLSKMIHNSTHYTVNKTTDEDVFSAAGRKTFYSHMRNMYGQERYDLTGEAKGSFQRKKVVCSNKDKFTIHFKIPVYKILNPRDREENPEFSQAIQEMNVFDDEAEMSLKRHYGEVYEKMEEIEEARRMRVIALSVGLSLGAAVLFIGLIVGVILILARRHDRSAKADEDHEHDEDEDEHLYEEQRKRKLNKQQQRKPSATSKKTLSKLSTPNAKDRKKLLREQKKQARQAKKLRKRVERENKKTLGQTKDNQSGAAQPSAAQPSAKYKPSAFADANIFGNKQSKFFPQKK